MAEPEPEFYYGEWKPWIDELLDQLNRDGRYLQTRSINVMSACYDSIGDVARATDAAILRCPNCGPFTLADIRAVIPFNPDFTDDDINDNW